MATGLVLTVAQTLFAALQCTELRKLCSSFGYESQLEKLRGTVKTINAVLLDAEYQHQKLTTKGRDWIEKLKDAVYDADDLFDEVTTRDQQLKRMSGGKNSEKVGRFFSGNTQFIFPFREINQLREKLDGIAKDHSQFGLSEVYKTVKRREETAPFVNEFSIIGREVEKEAIVEMLLSDVAQSNVSFVSIVGMGGLGKTAVAQLVFGNREIKNAFKEENMYWVCVSEKFGRDEIVEKMHKGGNKKLDEVYEDVRKQIEGKRYLLVLDDVWSEDHLLWVELRDLLTLGGRGSRILVTSRSMKVANSVGDNVSIYKLQGLSDDNSWDLFKCMAFKSGNEQEDAELVNIGKAITKKCANVPLSIRVIGILLYGQDKNKWQSFESIDFGELGLGEEGIMPTLKFSYYHLTSQLKSCFSLCSLFPKDYVIEKGELLSMWLALGYLNPGCGGQSMEDVGEEYFSVLLNRRFFHDVKYDEYGKVRAFKMLDLIHDLAQEVAGKESLMFTKSASHYGTKIRHLSGVACAGSSEQDLFNHIKSKSELKTMRTFLCRSTLSHGNADTLMSECNRLRALDLANCCPLNTLPSSLGQLLHLRYLNLSGNNNLQLLPESITDLYNLQVLNLRNCGRLKELPLELRKLVNLRHLDVSGCNCLKYMPVGMHNLTCLQTLRNFIVGGENSSQVQRAELIDLKALVNLGELFITVWGYSSNSKPNGTEFGANILTNAHLNALKIRFLSWDQGHVDEVVLDGLHPNSDLSSIEIDGYRGTKLPRWALEMPTYLPRLVCINLSAFVNLQHLSSLSELSHLKSLKLYLMRDLEYIESEKTYTPSVLAKSSMTFFPSLEKLELYYMKNLKGWWRDLVVWEQAAIPSFPCLKELKMEGCLKLAYFPPCPRVKQLNIQQCNKALTFCMKEGVPSVAVPPIVSSSSSSNLSSFSEAESCNSRDDPMFLFEKLEIDDVRLLNSVLEEFARGAAHISIQDPEGDSLSVCKEGFQKYCASSLQHLSIYRCHNLMSLSGGGMEHLTNLQSLCIECCCDLDLEQRDDKEGNMPWKSLHSLSSLALRTIPKLEHLPSGLQHLTSLQSLHISFCENLKALPPWFTSLTSLRSLELLCCTRDLSERCRQPDGEDWPKICHIPHLDVR